MYSNDVGIVELQPLHTGPSSSRLSPGARWQQEVSEPRNQKKLWISVGVCILIAAGVIYATTSTTHGKQQQQHLPPPSAQQPGAVPQRFPVEPFLAPASICLLDTQPLGPELQPAIPLSYEVTLHLSDRAFFKPGDATARVAAGFPAAVIITLHVEQDTSCLSLHAHNLTFINITASLRGATWKQQQPQVQTQPEVCLCGVQPGCLTEVCGRLFKARPGAEAPGLPQTAWVMSLGPYTAPAGSTLLLQVAYTAHFGSRQGLWRSAAYPSVSTPGEQVVALSTEFEAIAARMVLPCLDEPRYKATFVVHVEAPQGLVVLSNMPAASTLNSSDGQVARVTFMPTHPMSTYLLSVAVGELQGVSARSNSGHTVGVWTTPGTIAAAAVPLELSVSALQHYQAFTGINQTRGGHTKWDLLAVPGKTGAVENWALLIMDPERFLYRAGGAWDLFRCANVICHELGHQWFGNLVTAASWPDLLVNEGLASLLEYGCMARVLTQQIGPAGAAVLMHGMLGAPAGVMPGVHEGPFARTLNYDASPLAQPLLGSGVVEFAVPVYSKAAALMASLSHYGAAAAGANNSTVQRLLAYGPIGSLLDSTPPSALQETLQQHLQQHAFSTATAQDVLQRVLQLTPAALSSNAVAVMTGWQSPGSPLITLEATTQGIKLTQRRFCSWGLLADDVLTQTLTAAGSPAEPPTLPTGTGAVAPGASGALFCPRSPDGQDRAVPWTPVLVSLLPPATANSSNSSTAGQLCGQWVVLAHDAQAVDPTTAAQHCPDGTTAAHVNSPGYVLDTGGGWGLFRSCYPAEQRAALRQWIVGYAKQGRSVTAEPNGNSGSWEVNMLLTASKVLQDQAALAVSVFGEVPGQEVWAVLQAAVDAARAAHATTTQQTKLQATPTQVGFGAVLYSLLGPVVPIIEGVLDRLAGVRTCWLQQQELFAAAIAPVATAALSAFAASTPPSSSSSSINHTAAVYPSPDVFLGAMSLNRLLTAAALVDAGTANSLCERFNQAAAAISSSSSSTFTGGAGVEDAAALLSHIHPDLQHAVLDVAAAQPPGCQLDWSGDVLLNTLLQWHKGSREPRIATLAAFALAHFPARGHHAALAWPDILAVLLALNSTALPPGNVPPLKATAPPASGISPAKHAVELAVLVSRAVTISRRFPQPEIAPAVLNTATEPSNTWDSAGEGQQAGPVSAVLTTRWQQLVGSVGEATAWDVVREVAALEVRTAQQWQVLAAWAQQQVPSAAAGADSGPAVRTAQRKRVQALLGAAWSSVSWLQSNTDAVCRS